MAKDDRKGHGAPASGRKNTLTRAYDVVSGAVASRDGKRVFVDRHIPKKFDKFLAVHERAEARAMAKGMSYADAHTKVATPAERRAVEKAGLSWAEYEHEINGHLAHVEHEKVCKAPRGKTQVSPRAAIKK